MRADLDRPRRRVVGRDRPKPQEGALEDLAQGRDHVARLQGPRRGFGQERCVEQEVDVVDQHQAGGLLRQQSLQLARGVRAAEPTTGDDDVPGHEASLSACNKLLQVQSALARAQLPRIGRNRAPVTRPPAAP